MKPTALGPQTAQVVAHLNLTLIEVADPQTLDLLRADRRLARFLEAQLSPTLVVVQPGSAEQVIQQLRRLGHFPRIVTLHPATAA